MTDELRSSAPSSNFNYDQGDRELDETYIRRLTRYAKDLEARLSDIEQKNAAPQPEINTPLPDREEGSRAALSAPCVVVPREPTVKMRQAAYTAYRSCENTVSDWAVYVYRAMLAAAPAARPTLTTDCQLTTDCKLTTDALDERERK